MSDVSKTNELIENARARAREVRERFPATSTTLGDANWIDTLADALDRATRVPVQGEPNDDREALIEKIAGTIAVNELLREGMTWGDLLEKDRESYRITARNVASLASRATVPDAATEGRMSLAELEDIAETHAFCADRLFIETELVDEIRAERDTALAAIERCRAFVSALAAENGGRHSIPVGNLNGVLAALDGAPEPEERP